MDKTKVYAKHDIIASLRNKDGSRRFKYIIHTGSSRSSKTTSIIQWIEDYNQDNPKTRATVWRDTRAGLGSTVWSDFRKLFGHKHEFTRQATPIFYSNKSTFEPHGADSTNAHGLTQDVAWLNEPYRISKEVFDQIDQRTSELIIIDWNPKQGHWIDKLAKHPRAIVIHSTYKDNPFCPIEQKIKIESYEPTPENIEAGTADEYMWQVYGLGLKAEKPNKIYHGWVFDLSVEDFEEIEAITFYGIDFGSNSPSAINRHKVEVDAKRLNTDELYYGPIKNDEDYVSILERLEVPKNSVVVCDSAQPVTIATLRRGGYTRAIGANKKGGSVMQGIKFMQSFNHRLTTRSKNIKNEYDGYEWAVDRYDLPLDAPIKKDDHAMDEIRYVLFEAIFILRIKI